MVVQLQLSLEDVLSSLMQSPPSKQKYKPLQAPMRKKQLPWNLHCPGHSPMPIIILSPYSFAQTVSPCVKPSSHPILECSPSTIPLPPFRLRSSSSRSLAILPFQVTILPKKHPKKLPQSPQTQFFLFLYPVPFKSLTRQFATLHQYTKGLCLQTTSKSLSRRKTDLQRKR